jgi:hypothetical protein
MWMTVNELERVAREANPALAKLLEQLLREKEVRGEAVVRVPMSLLNLTTT